MHSSFEESLKYYDISPYFAKSIWNFIEAQYTGPTRFYHNLNHILEMQDFITAYAYECDDVHSVRLAAWFHDLIYDTHRKDNEEQSAAYAKMALEWLTPSRQWYIPYKIHTLVLQTKSHNPITPDEVVLCDADLIRFAGDFQKNSQDIRSEYSWVSDEEYAVGRNAALNHFLDKPRIFHIESVFEKYEDIARSNIIKGLL